MNSKKFGSLPKDGREKGDYESKYPLEIRKKQWREAIYISILMVISLTLISLAFFDIPFKCLGLTEEKINIAVKVIYCIAAGLLGGASNSMKIFYRAVANKWWNEDRIFWRVFSPIISVPVSLVACALFWGQINNSVGFHAIAIGFIAGYFSDEAVSKMYDIAIVIFSRDSTKKEEDDFSPKDNEDN